MLDPGDAGVHLICWMANFLLSTLKERRRMPNLHLLCGTLHVDRPIIVSCQVLSALAYGSKHMVFLVEASRWCGI